MSLWLLQRINLQGPLENGDVRAMVVRAGTAEWARVAASLAPENGAVVLEYWGSQGVPWWLDARASSCVQIEVSGTAGVVLAQFQS